MNNHQRDFGIFHNKTNHISASNSGLDSRGRDLHFWKEVFGRTVHLDHGPRLVRLAPASEVAGGHTLQF
jgi:hypothetical protein